MKEKAGRKDRYKLINCRYFTGTYKNSEELWLEVADYLEQAYDMEHVKDISARILAIDKRVVQKRLKMSCNEVIGNIIVLNIGKRTWISEALKSLRGT